MIKGGGCGAGIASYRVVSLGYDSRFACNVSVRGLQWGGFKVQKYSSTDGLYPIKEEFREFGCC